MSHENGRNSFCVAITGASILTLLSLIAIALYCSCIIILNQKHSELADKFNSNASNQDNGDWCILSMDYDGNQMLTNRGNRCDFTIGMCIMMIGCAILMISCSCTTPCCMLCHERE